MSRECSSSRSSALGGYWASDLRSRLGSSGGGGKSRPRRPVVLGFSSCSLVSWRSCMQKSHGRTPTVLIVAVVRRRYETSRCGTFSCFPSARRPWSSPAQAGRPGTCSSPPASASIRWDYCRVDIHALRIRRVDESTISTILAIVARTVAAAAGRAGSTRIESRSFPWYDTGRRILKVKPKLTFTPLTRYLLIPSLLETFRNVPPIGTLAQSYPRGIFPPPVVIIPRAEQIKTTAAVS